MSETVPDPDKIVESSARLCPLLDRSCLRERCQFWMRDWQEERNRYSVNCAIVLIAAGVNDESLFRLKSKKPIT